ncbi:T9SS type A sorting domain-containing protein, partial [Pseudotenacibaculum sp. MALMAid0570]|uniref:T9SS type A sorting domain-containing protein n=1 Tax=Pseudotenacibaculum sp. MALMAid0570 TaxID=3143938 RepID=UPI0032DF404C
LNADGTRIAIGAYLNDGNGTDAGHVRVYGESGGTWTQLGGDIDGEAAGDVSGYSVSLNDAGDYLIVGGLNNDDNGNNAGHARIYNFNGTSWVQIGADIDGQTADEQFGFSVSINGDGTIVAIGARRHSPAGIIQVYEFSGGTWNQLGSDIEGETSGEWFGYSVSISADGTYLVGGARRNNNSAGKARVFKYASGDWTQVGSDIVGEATSDLLSNSVSISGNASTVVIGAPLNDANGTDAGQVKIISVSPASIEVTTDDPISIAANYAYLGGQVVHEGLSTVTERGIVYSTANPDPFIGDDNVTKVANGSGLGSFTQKTTSLLAETIYYVKAYATNSQGTTYGESKPFLSGLPIQIGQEITGSNNEDRYGQDIVLNSNGTVMVVGAPKNDTNGTDTGQVTAYELIGDEWMPKGNVLNGSATVEAIGYSVSINDAGTIIAIATTGSITQGHVSIYEYNSGGNTWDLKGSSIAVNSSASVKLNADGTKLAVIFDENNVGVISTVRTYEFNGSSWAQYGNDIDGLHTQDVDISNDGSRVITAYLSINSVNGNNSFVRVYEYNSGNDTWDQLGNDLEESIPDLDFGTSLSLNGDGTIAAVTAYTSKQIYSYQESGGTWTPMGSAISSTETIESIQLDDTGEFLTVGYNGDVENKGYIRTYNFSADNWIQTYTSIHGKSADDLFGKSISISGDGNSFAVGAPSQLSTAKGTVRIFQTFGLPVVTTDSITSITGTTADFNGTVTSGAGSSITARGFVYSSSQADLTIGANGVIQIESGTGLESFQQTATNLYFYTTYYVRAYATNANGTSYGKTMSFTTSHDEYNILHTTGLWEEGDKWSYTRSPIETDNTLILEGRTGTLDTGNKTVGKLIIRPGAKLTIESGKSLITTDSLNIEEGATLEIESGGSLIVNGASTGKITYKRYLPNDNWYTISPPVQGQTFGSFEGSNNLATGNGYVGLITYHNDGGGYNSTGWEFYDYPLNPTDSARVLETGKGYAVRLPDAGTISFTGAAATSNVIIDTPVGATDFSYLIGNPYPAYLPANATTGSYTIIDENDSNMFEKSLWIWDNIQYDYISINDASTARYIAPGQGFFIQSNPEGTQRVKFLKTQRYHQTDVFNRTAQSTTTRPEIKLFVDDGVRKRDTDIFYIEGTTTGFDNGYDATMFTILPDVSEIFTHMVSDSEGKDFDIQSLPNSNYEEMVVPIGISAVAGKELIFSATAVNFPEGIHVYLEDKETETFTRLDLEGAEYKVTLTEDITTIGRFYLHTNTSAILSLNSVDTQHISIYLKDKDLLNVTGIYNQESQLKIYNIQGKEVFATNFKGTGLNEIRLPKLSSGIYIVRLQNKSGEVNKKIVLH